MMSLKNDVLCIENEDCSYYDLCCCEHDLLQWLCCYICRDVHNTPYIHCHVVTVLETTCSGSHHALGPPGVGRTTQRARARYAMPCGLLGSERPANGL